MPILTSEPLHVQSEQIDTTDYSIPFEPEIEDEAEYLGFTLALVGEDPHSRPDWSLVPSIAFYQGHRRGKAYLRRRGRKAVGL